MIRANADICDFLCKYNTYNIISAIIIIMNDNIIMEYKKGLIKTYYFTTPQVVCFLIHIMLQNNMLSSLFSIDVECEFCLSICLFVRDPFLCYHWTQRLLIRFR